MKLMKEKILAYLANHPKTRKRYIAADLGTYHLNNEFMHAMRELQTEGKIDYESVNDFANMEFYDLWFICDPSHMTAKERTIQQVRAGLTEPGCPDYVRECPYIGRGSESGACCSPKWYDCEHWEKVFQEWEKA